MSKPTPKQITNQPTWESGSSLRTSLCGTRSLGPFVWSHHRALHKKERMKTLKTGFCTMFCQGGIGLWFAVVQVPIRKMRLDLMKISLINAPLVIKHTHVFCAHQQHINHTPTCLLVWHEEVSPFDGICSGIFWKKVLIAKIVTAYIISFQSEANNSMLRTYHVA